jgi:hypothetical protein
VLALGGLGRQGADGKVAMRAGGAERSELRNSLAASGKIKICRIG